LEHSYYLSFKQDIEVRTHIKFIGLRGFRTKTLLQQNRPGLKSKPVRGLPIKNLPDGHQQSLTPRTARSRPALEPTKLSAAPIAEICVPMENAMPRRKTIGRAVIVI
jgi:hypothetical protein